MNNEDQGRIQLPPFAPMIMDRNLTFNSQSSSPQDQSQKGHNQGQHQGQGQGQQQQHQQQASRSRKRHSSSGPSAGGSTTSGPGGNNMGGNGRLRVKKACDRCKKQKTKCDGEQPCLTCSRHGHKCEYTTIVPVTTIIDKNKDNKHNLRVHGGNDDDGYIQFLENRVHELETQNKNKIGINFHNSNLNDEIFDKNFYTFSRDKYRVMRRYQNILPHELGSIVLENLGSDFYKRELIVPRIQFYGWNMNGGHYLKQRKLPPFENLINLKDDQELKMSNWLLNFFLEKLNPLYGILHESVFRDQYENYLSSLNNEQHDQSTRLFTSILYLVFAISLRYSENHPDLPFFIKQKNYPSLEEKLFDQSYEVISKLSFEWESFELVQSWILITLYLRTCHRQISSYTSLGIAIRMCKGMGMNLNRIPASFHKKIYEHIKIKRIFWCVYTWDRIFGFQSGKHFEIYDDLINMELPSLPSEGDDFSSDGWITKPSLAMIHLAKISGDIQQLSTQGQLTDEIIENVSKELKVLKKWCDDNITGEEYDELLIDQIYLTYHDIILNLHNKVLFKLLDKDIQMNSTTQIQILLLHSSQILEIFVKIHQRGLILVPWWLNLVLLFNISLIGVILINSGLHLEQAQFNFQQAMEYLNFLREKGKIGMTKECIWALKMLNHLILKRMEKSILALRKIGIDHGSENVNKIKFLQFGKVDDNDGGDGNNNNNNNNNNHVDRSNTPINVHRKNNVSMTPDLLPSDEFQSLNYPSDSSQLSTDDLLGNLKWFDQWVSEFNQ